MTREECRRSTIVIMTQSTHNCHHLTPLTMVMIFQSLRSEGAAFHIRPHSKYDSSHYSISNQDLIILLSISSAIIDDLMASSRMCNNRELPTHSLTVSSSGGSHRPHSLVSCRVAACISHLSSLVSSVAASNSFLFYGWSVLMWWTHLLASRVVLVYRRPSGSD
jgi:hypothetical protein